MKTWHEAREAAQAKEVSRMTALKFRPNVGDRVMVDMFGEMRRAVVREDCGTWHVGVVVEGYACVVTVFWPQLAEVSP